MKHFPWLLSACVLLTAFLTVATAAQSNVNFEITKESFFEEGLAPVRKSGPYDVTIVYFMDYQCPACRKYTPDVERVLKEDPRIRIIYRDTPLLGPRSDKAALAAIASSFQGRHEGFHHALMMTKGPLDDHAIKAAALKAGVNWPRLERDMISRREDIDLLIARNFDLATDIGIAGTPAFIIGDSQSNGALDYQALKLEIADARKALGAVKILPNAGLRPGPATGTPETTGPETQSETESAQQTTRAPAVSEGKGLEPSRSSSNPTSSASWKWFAGIILGVFALTLIWAAARKTSRGHVAGK